MPNVAVIIGEGGSGGAIAIATANRVLMLEHAIYSVISPEGAASILWRDTAKAQDAATNMKITAQDLDRFGVIDRIITEPVGGAHRDPGRRHGRGRRRGGRGAAELKALDRETVRRQRRDKFLAIGRGPGLSAGLTDRRPRSPPIARQPGIGRRRIAKAVYRSDLATILPFVHPSHAQSAVGVGPAALADSPPWG